MLEDKLQEYLESKKFYHFEGERGVERLETVMQEVCGYSNAWSGTMSNFFADNPGAMEAVLTWIGEQRVAEWEENLDSMGFVEEVE